MIVSPSQVRGSAMPRASMTISRGTRLLLRESRNPATSVIVPPVGDRSAFLSKDSLKTTPEQGASANKSSACQMHRIAELDRSGFVLPNRPFGMQSYSGHQWTDFGRPRNSGTLPQNRLSAKIGELSGE